VEYRSYTAETTLFISRIFVDHDPYMQRFRQIVYEGIKSSCLTTLR